MTEHRIGTQEEWQAERGALLKEEKELTRRGDELARKRRELPWVPVEKDYRFETEGGTKTLADLFDGRSQLLVYHFMFGPDWDAGCPVCTSITDTLERSGPASESEGHDAAAHVPRAAREAPRLPRPDGMEHRLGLERRQRLQSRHRLPGHPRGAGAVPQRAIPPTVELNAEQCGTDVGGYVSEGPGMSVYALSDGTVYRTYVTTARGLEFGMAYYGLLDRTPKGRNEAPDQPLWVRRHDEY